MDEESPSCGNCAYSDIRVMSSDEEPALICRRYPPIAASVPHGLTMLFVNVESDDWCGKHQRLKS